MSKERRRSGAFGEFIRSKRIEKKLGLKEVADSAGIAVSFLSDVEHGRRNPFKEEVLRQIAKRLEVKTKVLIELAKEQREVFENNLKRERTLQMARSITDLSQEKIDRIKRIIDGEDENDDNNRGQAAVQGGH